MKSRFSALLACVLALSSGAQDYKQALPGYRFEFPRDHFDHPEYRTEWWYYTGNLKSSDGHRFGFELTFFRQGVARDQDRSTWRIHDLYMAHLALSDISGRHFYHDERINRAGPGMAGVEEGRGLVWNGNWQVQLNDAKQTLQGATEQFAIRLDLAPVKPPVIHGIDGISRKGEGAGHASHYISFTRLGAAGTIQLNGTSYSVQGTSWMDHEFFSDRGDPAESGWDWLGLQLDDNTEVMLYRLRHKDGSVDPYSSGSYIDAQGKRTFLSIKDFTMMPVGDIWTSRQTRGIYPLRWHVAIPGLGLDMDISTPLNDQELFGGVGPSYWEGAIDVKGRRGGNELHGSGYLEMTGYAAAGHDHAETVGGPGD